MDDAVRTLVRAWEERGDQQTLQRAIDALRRAGLVAPRRLLDARRYAPRSFRSRLKAEVATGKLAGPHQRLGETPGEVAIPEHRTFMVIPRPSGRMPRTLPQVLDANAAPSVDLHYCRTESDDLARIAAVPTLREVAAHAHDDEVAAFASMPSLEVLVLDGSAMRGDSMAALEDHTRLHELRLGYDPWLEDMALERLPPRLLELSLAGSQRLGAAGFGHLERLAALEALDVSKTTFDDSALARLAEGARRLMELDISRCTIGPTGLARLAGLPSFEKLTASGVRRRRADVDALGSLGRLTHLELAECELDDEALSPLASAAGLRSLTLDGNSFLTSAGLSNLRSLRKLEHLRLMATNVANIDALVDLTALEGLALQRTPVSDEGLRALERLGKLEWLSLSSCPNVTDAAVPVLAHLRSLREIWIDRTAITERGRAALATALPAAQIDPF